MKLGYVIVYVPDVAATVAFYEQAFGLARRFVHESGQYAEMETGATALAFVDEDLARTNGGVFMPNRPGQKPAGIEVALVVDDVPAAFAHAVANGAIGKVPPATKPWGQVVSYVRDLNGVLVEMCSALGG